MKNNTFIKEYIAVCKGLFEEKQGTIDLPIGRKENSIIERCIDYTNGSPSITHYTVIQENIYHNELYSIVKCKLETGKTHQIRVHLNAIGHPLIGDTLYSSVSPLILRQALHSYRMEFVHPISKKKMKIEADLPEDIKIFLK